MECSICMETIGFSAMYTTSCGHKFHKNCISSWTNVVESCPICRTDIISEDEQFAISHINALFNINNFQNKVPLDETTRKIFVDYNLKMLEVLRNQGDPILSSNYLMRDQVRYYQQLRLESRLKSDQIELLNIQIKLLNLQLTLKPIQKEQSSMLQKFKKIFGNN